MNTLANIVESNLLSVTLMLLIYLCESKGIKLPLTPTPEPDCPNEMYEGEFDGHLLNCSEICEPEMDYWQDFNCKKLCPKTYKCLLKQIGTDIIDTQQGLEIWKLSLIVVIVSASLALLVFLFVYTCKRIKQKLCQEHVNSLESTQPLNDDTVPVYIPSTVLMSPSDHDHYPCPVVPSGIPFLNEVQDIS